MIGVLRCPLTSRTVVRTTLKDLRTLLAGVCVFNGWNDHLWDRGNPAQIGIRPSMETPESEGGRGPGGSLMHQFGVWALSTPDNLVFLKSDTDDTLISFMVEHGFLHRFCKVADADQLFDEVRAGGRLLLGNDCYQPRFDPYVLNSRRMMTDIEDKAQLSRWVEPLHLPVQAAADIADGPGLEQTLRAISDGGSFDVFVKSTDGRHGAHGVWRLQGGSDFNSMIRSLRQLADEQLECIGRLNRLAEAARALAENPEGIRLLSTVFVLQREVVDCRQNGAFQILLDPSDKSRIKLLALSEQICSADGAGRGHYNPPFNRFELIPLLPAVSSLVERVWREFPDAAGVLKCDFFLCKDERVVLYDLGLRTSGNTPAAVYQIHAEERGFSPFLRSDWLVRTGEPNATFAEAAAALGELLAPPEVFKNHRGLQPIGWNQVSGDGRFILMPGDGSHPKESTEVLAREVLDRLRSRFPGVAAR